MSLKVLLQRTLLSWDCSYPAPILSKSKEAKKDSLNEEKKYLKCLWKNSQDAASAMLSICQCKQLCKAKFFYQCIYSFIAKRFIMEDDNAMFNSITFSYLCTILAVFLLDINQNTIFAEYHNKLIKSPCEKSKWLNSYARIEGLITLRFGQILHSSLRNLYELLVDK
ncbi:hypothetical protein EDC96DRAFT_548685 [Choanephora cucurbitarum]|nr:hypothetical protein EDC96DRAFT_548685 [Choanephora cucurbitarum]